MDTNLLVFRCQNLLVLFYRLHPYALEVTERAELPFLLMVDKTSDKAYKWEEELQSMGVSTLLENLGYSNCPDEAVYVMGHPDFSQGCEGAFLKYIK